MHPTRREVLGALAIGPLAALHPRVRAAAESPDGASPAMKNLIDVHHHPADATFLALLRRFGGVLPGGANEGATFWSADSAIAMMNRLGVSVAALSFPPIELPDVEPQRVNELNRACNDHLADLVRRNGRRFIGLGALPLPDVDASVAEIDRIFDTLDLAGVSLVSNVHGRYLGHPDFAPVFAALNRRKARVFIHPTHCYGCVLPPWPDYLVELPADTTRAVFDLIASGTFTATPDVRYILAHAGGALPYLASRLATAEVVLPDLKQRVPDGVEAALKRCYYDTAIASHPRVLATLLDLVGPHQIVFGSDFPYVPEPALAGDLKRISDFAASASVDFSRNSSALFPDVVFIHQ